MHSEVKKYMSKLGKKGGKNRAMMYSKEQLSEWAKKGGPKPKKHLEAEEKKLDGEETVLPTVETPPEPLQS